MTWTASLLDYNNIGDCWKYRIVYSDGAQKFVLTYTATSLTDSLIQQTAIAQVNTFNTAAVAPNLTKIQPGQQIDLTPPAEVNTPPDPAVTARQKHNAAVQTLHKLKEQQADSMPVTQTQIDNAQKAAQALWLDSYAGT